MNNKSIHPRIADPRHGGGGLGGGGQRPIALRQQHQQQQRQQGRRQQVAPNGASRQQSIQQRHDGGSIASQGGGGMEALVLQKLQGALSAVRRERDQEFRNRNMAQEKLRSAQEASQSTRKSVQEEASKLDENNKKTQQAIQDIQKMDESIADLSRKYEFKHDDLIRKRDKIMQHTVEAEKEGEAQEKTTDSALQLQEKQQGTYETAKKKAVHDTVLRVVAQVKAGKFGPSAAQELLLSQQKRDEDVLRRHLQALDGKSSLLILPKVVKEKAATVEAEATLINSHLSRVRALLEKYHQDAELEEMGKNDDEIGATFSSPTLTT